MKVLLTAFEAFNNDTINPSEEILKNIKDIDIKKLLLPVSYEKSTKLLINAIRKEKVDFVLSLGYAARREELSLEKCAYNQMASTIPDNDGNIKIGEKINKECQDVIYTNADTTRILKGLSKYKMYESCDPGRYICNLVYFTALNEMDGNAVFVHIPPLDTMKENGKSLDFLVDAIKDLIKILKGE